MRRPLGYLCAPTGAALFALSFSLPVAAQRITTGMATGGGTIALFSGGVLDISFDSGFAGGARVAMGDVNGDGNSDYVVGAAPGAAPVVCVFSGVDRSLIHAFLAYDVAFTGGVFVAAGDFNGDGRADVVTGADAGGSPQVKVFSGLDVSVLKNYLAFAPSFTGGVRVAAGDVNDDLTPDLIAAAGPGGGPTVTVFSGTTDAVLQSVLAYDPGFTGGVYVAAGNIDGDGNADIVTGSGAGGGPHVKVFSGATYAEIRSFFAFTPSFSGGVTVAAGRIDGDTLADIIVGAASTGGQVIAFRGTDLGTLQSFQPYGAPFTGGVFVASSGASPVPVELQSFRVD